MKPELSQFDDETLRKELTERGVAADSRKTLPAPTPIKKPNFSKVRKMAIDSVVAMADENEPNVNAVECIYEAVMEAVYGPDFWDWFNDNRQPWN